MRKTVCFAFLCICGTLFFSGCSMMPDDEEIIKWSILENEIFWEELVDEELNDENFADDAVEDIQNDGEFAENDEKNEEWNTEIQVETVE